MSTLILIDGKNALYRFGFAHRTLTNAEGKPTGAVYGMLGALVRLKKTYPDAQFIVAWDGRGKSWRHKFYPQYKSNRSPDDDKPDEVKAVLEQHVVIKQILLLLSIPQIEVPTVEADDLIGICAVQRRAFGLPVVVYSSDKDFMQLMAAGVTIIRPQTLDDNTRSGLQPETPESVMKKFGCSPDDIIKVRAYAGDKSDAIPTAIPGIGEKRALACIKAGADPSKEKFECSDLKLFSKLRTGWAEVRRNFLLMRIAGMAEKAVFGASTAKAINAVVAKAQTVMTNPTRLRKDYLMFVSLLVELDLWEAMENRILLWRVQHKA